MERRGIGGGREIAVFPFAFQDTSIEGEVGGVDPTETARLSMITREVETRLAARGAEIFDLSGREETIAGLPDPWDCLDCAAPIARSAEARANLTGFVHKVSTLIQSISIIAHDTETDRMLGNASVSIRGNTDEAWRRGVDFILKRGLLGEEAETALNR
ncbi:DUF3280 domain-containing protein [Breoghania sp.]|uniref:DUF3280 domain-containing protein n=1 Tax=Breoghania sp. TaxID=2065378 RepID=UPI00262B375B|nr:DUF3280 domain-containing protein [Breoghania sp.]MDJ0931737.1 DUF3280 domain-containing protein [Breoghania sp.]